MPIVCFGVSVAGFGDGLFSHRAKGRRGSGRLCQHPFQDLPIYLRLLLGIVRPFQLRQQLRTGCPDDRFVGDRRLAALLLPPQLPGGHVVAEVLSGEPDEGNLGPLPRIEIVVIREVNQLGDYACIAKQAQRDKAVWRFQLFFSIRSAAICKIAGTALLLPSATKASMASTRSFSPGLESCLRNRSSAAALSSALR